MPKSKSAKFPDLSEIILIEKECDCYVREALKEGDKPVLVRCPLHEAAPDLLEVLEDIKIFYESYGKDGDIPGSEAVDFLWKIYGDAKAAISKCEVK